jgi:hypothetical protein
VELAALHPNVEIVVIADGPAERVRPLVEAYRTSWTQIIDGKAIHRLYRVTGTPQYFLVDRDGTLRCSRCSLDRITSSLAEAAVR